MSNRQVGVTAVVGLEDGELPSAGVGDADAELAVLARTAGSQAVTGLRDECPVKERQRGPVGRQLRRHRPAAASAAAVVHAPDCDPGRRGARRGTGRAPGGGGGGPCGDGRDGREN